MEEATIDGATKKHGTSLFWYFKHMIFIATSYQEDITFINGRPPNNEEEIDCIKQDYVR